MWNLNHDTNEPIYTIETHSQIQRLVVVREKESSGRMEWEVGISRYKLLYREWISNKVLL